MLVFLALAAALCTSGPLGIGVEVQRSSSGRGTAVLAGRAAAEVQDELQAGGHGSYESNISGQVVEWNVLANGVWDHRLSERWSGSVVGGVGWSHASAEIVARSALGKTGYRWAIDALFLELDAGARALLWRDLSIAGELSVARATIGYGVLEVLESDSTLEEGGIGGSGSFLEDFTPSWRVRLKLGPRWDHDRFSAFPWVALGPTEVMTRNSRIADNVGYEPTQWNRLCMGLRLGWSL